MNDREVEKLDHRRKDKELAERVLQENAKANSAEEEKKIINLLKGLSLLVNLYKIRQKPSLLLNLKP